MDIIILQYSSSTVFYIHTTFHHHHPYLDRSPGWSSLPSSRTIPLLLVSTHKVYPSSPIPPTILPTNDSDHDHDYVSIITLHYHNDNRFFIPSSDYYININKNAALPSGVHITTTATTNIHCSITLSDNDSE